MISKPIITIWLDDRRAKKGNLFPVKIRITHKQNRYYYPTNINMNKSDFIKVISNSPGTKLKDYHFQLYELERQANATINKIVDELHLDFTIDLFEKFLNLHESDYKDVFKCQLKTAEGYHSALTTFQKYVGRQFLSFAEIDKKFLEEFELFMLKNNKSISTVGVYARYLRAIFNEAISEKMISFELYPFGRNKYQIPQSANNKRALDGTDLIKIINYKPEEDSWEEFAKDMWLFSMYCQGMNMKDIANLRYKNIDGDRIIFTRNKTKRTRRSNQKSIIVYLTDDALEIINRRGNPKSLNNFVFPIYSDENSDHRNMRIVEQQLKMLNKYIRKIAENVGIKQDVTFYGARHSFATTLKRQGRSTEEIQEFIGHTDKRTTELYLASFGDDHKRNVIRNFVNEIKQLSDQG
jgi:integrase/recombinase XerD